MQQGWLILLLGVGLLNALTFALFGWDKRLAVRERRRISERTLLACCLLGGWLGGWSAMRVFRHKTRKLSFKLQLVLITAAWVTAAGVFAYRWLA